MHVRINIPAWGASELWHGALALVRGGYCAALAQELRASAPAGWRPVLLASARYGLALAVAQLRVKRVAVPGYVCPAVLTGLQAAGAEVVAVDCAPASFRYDAEQLTTTVRAGLVDAVLAPNTYGLDQDFAFLKGLGVPVIEDAAYQAGYADCGWRGTIGVWSFNFKALTGVGGGVLWVTDGALEIDKLKSVTGNFSAQAALFLNYAVRAVAREHLPKALGGAAPPAREGETKARAVLQEMRAGPMPELPAALALTQWRRRATLAARQAENSRQLGAALAHSATLTPVADTEQNVKVHLFPMLAQTPEAAYQVRQTLYQQGIQTEAPYPVLLGARHELPGAHDLATRLVLVPCHASLGTRQIGLISRALQDK